MSLIVWNVGFNTLPGYAATLSAGVAKVDITDRQAGPVNDPLYVKALVIKSDKTTTVLITVDAVAIGEIGPIKNDYLPKVRSQLERELGILPSHVLVNASHCHGRVCADVDERTVEAVKKAAENRVPVKVGAGVGHEERIMENRRLKLKSGKEADVRHAYSLPPDEEVAEVGPLDPQIGLLRLDRLDGSTLAVVYNFACHPIQGVPSGGNTADIIGFASKVIEDILLIHIPSLQVTPTAISITRPLRSSFQTWGELKKTAIASWIHSGNRCMKSRLPRCWGSFRLLPAGACCFSIIVFRPEAETSLPVV